jgi:enoyl-CoA hydratase/carnithine racemase
MSYETILLDVADDGVATLTLNRPEALNAWNGRMAVEVERALRPATSTTPSAPS